MVAPGLPVEQVFKNARIGVIRVTNEKQIPWEASSLTGNFCFAPETAAESTGHEKNFSPSSDKERSNENQEFAFWESIKNSQDPASFDTYLQKYPQGAFAEIAKI